MKPSEAIREIASRRAVDMGNGEKVFSVHPEDILEWLDAHAGGERVFNAATYAVLGEPETQAGGATASERERVPSAECSQCTLGFGEHSCANGDRYILERLAAIVGAGCRLQEVRGNYQGSASGGNDAQLEFERRAGVLTQEIHLGYQALPQHLRPRAFEKSDPPAAARVQEMYDYASRVFPQGAPSAARWENIDPLLRQWLEHAYRFARNIDAHAGGATGSESPFCAFEDCDTTVEHAGDCCPKHLEPDESCRRGVHVWYYGEGHETIGICKWCGAYESAISKSETTQPATGDGTGAARMFQLWAEGYGNEQTWGGLANNERAVWTEAFEFARELGAKEAQPHRIAVRVLRERDELKEKLAAAVEALEETRWSPDGAIAEWANTPDGKNHARVMRALGVLREEKT